MSEKTDLNISVSRDYIKGLEKKVSDLNTLIDVSAIISSTLDFNTLITLIMEKAKAVMNAEACSLLLYNRVTGKLEFEVALGENADTAEMLKKTITLDMGQGIAGWVAENRSPVLVEDVSKDSRFFKEADIKTGFITKSLLAVPLVGRGGLIGVAEVINPVGRAPFTEYDVEIFQTFCTQVSVAIENARFHKDALEKERLHQELELAAVVQKSFLPPEPSLIHEPFELSAVNIPAQKIGGDLYDFIELKDGHIGVLIGDVSGKGISAALYMAKVISDFRYIARIDISPDRVLNNLNAMLSRTSLSMFLTAIYMVINTVKEMAEFSIAGHPPIISIKKGVVDIINDPSGPPLGILPEFVYKKDDLSFDAGDRLFFVTDGVFDVTDCNGERLGFGRLSEFIKGHASSEDLMKELLSFVEGYSVETSKTDDITMVEIRRR